MEHKVVNHIDCHKEWEGEDDYSSHRPLLYLATEKMKDAIFYELGMGYGSTPLLKVHTSRLNSYETDIEWLLKFVHPYDQKISPTSSEKYQTIFISHDNNHTIWQIKDYKENVFINNEMQSVVFIDSKPGEERKDLVSFYADKANVIILHDTEKGAQGIYGITEVLNSFKYRLDYCPEGNPATTALSNKIDVTKWVE